MVTLQYDVHRDVIGCFIWDALATSMRRNREIATTSPRRVVVGWTDIALNNRLSFEDHLKLKSSKVNKTLGLLRKLHSIQLRSSLVTLHKAFRKPHLSYGHTIYDQASKATFDQKLEVIKYNPWLEITRRALRRTSMEQLYEDLGLASLQHRCWHRKLFFLNSTKMNFRHIFPN